MAKTVVASIVITTLFLSGFDVSGDTSTQGIATSAPFNGEPNGASTTSSISPRIDATATESVGIDKMKIAPMATSIEMPDLSKPVGESQTLSSGLAEAESTVDVESTETEATKESESDKNLEVQAVTPEQKSVATSKSKLEPIAPAKRESATDEPANGAIKAAPPKVAAKPKPRRPLTRDLVALKNRIENCQRFYYDKPLNTGDDSCWSVMHSFLGFGVNTPLALRKERGPRTNAIGWMCWNRSCAGYQLFYLQDGRIRTRQGPGYEGHKCQFLAMLAQVRVDKDYELRIQGQKFTVTDLIEEEKLTCYPGEELTFKLIALAHYLPSDARWTNDRGEEWSIPMLIREEISQKINGAACGGTHRLMGLSMAVNRRNFRGEPLDGEWARAADYVNRYHQYTLARLQNPDGSFSSDWFKKRSDWGDKDRQLQTTGHMLEWLIYSLPEERRRDPQVVKSVRFLTELMIRHRYHDWEVGPRGHALRTINLYYHLVLKDAPVMAKKPLNRIIRRSPR